MPKIHPTADVQTTHIGEGTTVWQFCVILSQAVIGKNCNINCQVFVENDVQIGDNVTIKPGVQIWDGVILEDNVFVGPNVTFTNDRVPRSKQYPEKFEKTIIKKGASLGANSTIITGKTVGEYALVGAGSVLTKDVPPYQVFYGNPATHKGYVTEKGVLVQLDMRDDAGNKYTYDDNKLTKIK